MQPTTSVLNQQALFASFSPAKMNYYAETGDNNISPKETP